MNTFLLRAFRTEAKHPAAPGLIALLLGLTVLLLGLAAPAAAQAYRIPDGYSTELVRVKLEEGSSPALIDAVLAPSLRTRAERVRPLITVAPERLAALKAEGERRTGRPVKDLRLWFEVRLTPGTDAAAFIEALRATPGVERAIPVPLPMPLPSEPLTLHEALAALADTPDHTGNQGYLGPATDGIDAEFAWTVPGGNGAGVRIIDIEYSWNQSHEDLSKAAGLALLLDAGDSAVDPFADDDHGTAVLGELIADNDAKGVTGISWGADIGMAPANTDDLGYDLPNAIALAVAATAAGDVILIEQQTAVCGLPGPCTGGNCGPSEWNDDVFDAVVAATAVGRIVVAAAGNGGVDLDQAGCDDKFDRSNRDSGAIIVGQGWAPGATDRERRPNSSYGSRVDLQGWGNSVMTTGYGAAGFVDPDDPGNRNKWYTNGFTGTSSASPMVAGSVANLQGIAKANALPLFTAATARDLLVATGSPQQGNTAEHIGPRPNLLAAIAEIINLPPVADAGADQTVECASHDGSEVTLDGSSSSDPNGDALTYTWREGGNVIATGVSPTVTLALGAHTIVLTVEDPDGETDTDEVLITIEDTTDPVITLLGDDPLTLECAIDDYLEPGATVADVCDPAPALVIDASEVIVATPGTYEVHYTAADASGNDAEETRTVEVVDTTPPVLTIGAGPMSLWPPNHKYHPVALDALDLEAADVCDLNVGPEDVVIALATSDEAEEVPDPGDGETYEDIVIAEECRSVGVRAERVMYGNGRVYTLGLAVADASGNVGEDDYEVHVPINARVSPWAVGDSPPLYTVEGCDPTEETLAAAADPLKAGGDTAGVAESARLSAEVPAAYVLDQNYPNPFGAETQIRFGLPEEGAVRLEVFDLLGRRVAVLADAPFAAGFHTVRWDGSRVAPGVYLYKLTAGPSAEVRRLVLQR